MKVQYVPVEYVHQTWPLVEGFISESMQYGRGDYTIDQTKANIAEGRWLLVVASDTDNKICGAAAIHLYNMPNARVAFVKSIGGKMISSSDTWQQFSELMRSRGATRIEGAVRPSIARLWARFGAEERYRILGVDL